MGKPEGFVMLYDERYQTIGLRPATQNERNFIELKVKKGVTHRINSAGISNSNLPGP
jgi:hypothetical protein